MAPAPGMMTRHYSPRTELLLYDGSIPAVVAAIQQDVLSRMRTEGPVLIALLAYSEDVELLRDLPASLWDLGSRHRLDEVARRPRRAAGAP